MIRCGSYQELIDRQQSNLSAPASDDEERVLALNLLLRQGSNVPPGQYVRNSVKRQKIRPQSEETKLHTLTDGVGFFFCCYCLFVLILWVLLMGLTVVAMYSSTTPARSGSR